MAAIDNINAELMYLERDALFETEKPYTLQYKPDGENFPRTNCSREIKPDVLIRDLRGHEGEFSVERQGFEVMNLESKMKYADFDSHQIIMDTYYTELKALFQSRFQPRRVEVLEHIVRRRHRTFPIATGKDYEFQQPTSVVHIDFTPAASLELAKWKFGIDSGDYAQVQMVNVWKPLKGPLMDWPLAVCDAETIDACNDLIPCDIVGRDIYTENQQVYYNPRQEWYYLGGQLPSELIVFLQSDTDTNRHNGVPHAGFRHPKTRDEDDLRESIEVRLFLFY